MTTEADIDAPALRQEIALRILLQNLLLITSLILFAVFAVLATLVPERAAVAAAAHGVMGLAASLQWCHHGIRTKQIKQYLLSVSDTAGWERWLPANRPQTLLGSRWMISTKGVFLGLQVAMIGLTIFIAPSVNLFVHSVAAFLLAASGGFLMTNPKE